MRVRSASVEAARRWEHVGQLRRISGMRAPSSIHLYRKARASSKACDHYNCIGKDGTQGLKSTPPGPGVRRNETTENLWGRHSVHGFPHAQKPGSNKGRTADLWTFLGAERQALAVLSELEPTQ